MNETIEQVWMDHEGTLFTLWVDRPRLRIMGNKVVHFIYEWDTERVDRLQAFLFDCELLGDL